ncbi:MAG: uncharacterized protein JWM81_633 [Candidatus Saccharibacteria bacterium]|nr:uncharacterized protein [Candidatus Saccharibacteria bacterium]
MSTYKVIQDIEAEDKILGPLTLKQFIFGIVTAFFLYLSFVVLTKGVAFLLVLFLPPALLFGFLAFPFGKDQPTEIWAAAKFQFLFRPRRRIWDQSGVKELVTITVPKKIERVYTDGLSQTEVRSRLHALADTIDSRGWAVKNVGASVYNQPNFGVITNDSDRLVSVSSMPQAVPDYQIPESADIMDDQTSPVAQQFTQMINASEQAHRKQLIDQLNEVRAVEATVAPEPAATQWFNGPAQQPQFAQQQAVIDQVQAAPQPAVLLPSAAPTVDPVPTAEEQAVVERAMALNSSKQVSNSHLRTLQPISQQVPQPAQSEPARLEPVSLSTAAPTAQPPTTPQPVTAQPDAAILNLANNNDLNISTLAREAQKAKNISGSDDEVVISLR